MLRIASFLQRSSVLELSDIRFSLLSGMVARTVVEGSEFDMAIDFTANDAFLYEGVNSCPLGVSNCYQSSLPMDLLAVSIVGSVTINHLPVSIISTSELPNDEGLKSRVVRFRDVYGSLGFGPDSQWINHRLVKIYETDDGGSNGFFKPVIRESRKIMFLHTQFWHSVPRYWLERS